jgi:hypothetical protein
MTRSAFVAAVVVAHQSTSPTIGAVVVLVEQANAASMAAAAESSALGWMWP